MSISPERIQVGQCYLMPDGTIRRVTSTDSDGWVRYKERVDSGPWQPGRLKRIKKQVLAAAIERLVPCDWTAERRGEGQGMG